MSEAPTVPAVVTLSDASVDAVARRVLELQGVAQVTTRLPQMQTSVQVMRAMGYSDRGAFLEAARAAGVPLVRINARKFVFHPDDVAAWIKRGQAQRHAVIFTTAAAERERLRANA